MHSNAPGEATKKRHVFGRLMSLSATYFQESAMAVTGEWRDLGLCCLKVIRITRLCHPFLALISPLIYTRATYINSTNLGVVVSFPW